MLRYFKYILISSFLLSSVYAGQWAVVKNEKAIIYADMRKTTPIGFVRQGKKVRVGEVGRAKGSLLPIVVSGKVAYIKIGDLYLSREFDEIKHAKKTRSFTRFEIEDGHDREDLPNAVRLGYKLFSAGSDWTDINSTMSTAQGLNATSSSFGSEFHFYYEHAISNSFIIGAGVKKVSLSASHLSYSGTFLSLLGGWEAMTIGSHHLHLEGMYHYGLSTAISSPFGNTSLSGSGYELAGKWTYDLTKSLALNSSLSYMLLNHTITPSTVITSSNFSTGGFAFDIGMSWFF